MAPNYTAPADGWMRAPETTSCMFVDRSLGGKHSSTLSLTKFLANDYFPGVSVGPLYCGNYLIASFSFVETIVLVVVGGVTLLCTSAFRLRSCPDFFPTGVFQ